MNYDVGYGKPPKKHHWKKGRSGNPRGRPRKKPVEAMTFNDFLLASVRKEIAAKLGGKTSKLTKLEALVEKAMTDALKGTPKQTLDFIRMLREQGTIEKIDSEAWAYPDPDDAKLESIFKGMDDIIEDFEYAVENPDCDEYPSGYRDDPEVDPE